MIPDEDQPNSIIKWTIKHTSTHQNKRTSWKINSESKLNDSETMNRKIIYNLNYTIELIEFSLKWEEILRQLSRMSKVTEIISK